MEEHRIDSFVDEGYSKVMPIQNSLGKGKVEEL